LRSSACYDHSFNLHSICGIGGRPPSNRDRWVRRAAGNTVPEGHISCLVHRDATHPAEVGIRGKGALLRQTDSSIGVLEFVPPNSSTVVDCHGVIYNQRLMATEVAVGKAVHEPVSQRIQLLSSAGLGDAGPAPAERGKRRHRYSHRAYKCGICRSDEIYMKFKQLEGIRAKRNHVIRRARRRRGSAIEI
jgi:hypothetical protein